MTSSQRFFQVRQALEALVPSVRVSHLRSWFRDDPERFERYSLQEQGCLLDYSKNWITPPVWEALLEFASVCDLAGKFESMCRGAIVNSTENQAAFHIGLRDFSDRPLCINQENVRPQIEDERARMLALVTELHEGRYYGATGASITDVVNIGIGGSDLGPRAVIDGLRPYHCPQAPRVHTLASVDGDSLHDLLSGLDPARTLFLIVSKSFTTKEVFLNAQRAQAWITQHLGNDRVSRHFVAITSNPEAVRASSLLCQHCLTLWPWVGGRYSLWSSVGFSIAVRVGAPVFLELLHGAYAMDQHSRTAPVSRNMPAILALLSVWYHSFCGVGTHAVVPYPERLSTFVAHLQQLEMESNGKRFLANNTPVDISTCPVVWGGAGNQGQHAYFQLLHQGTQVVPVDFILEAQPHHADRELHQHLVTYALAQSQALMSGTEDIDQIPVYQSCPGHQPSTTLFFDQLTPFNLGRLVALYEHKVAMQGILLNINSFDQWGVALGKRLASDMESFLLDPSQAYRQDGSTRGLLRFFLEHYSS